MPAYARAEIDRVEQAPPGRSAVVYRRHDAVGRLLYIGCTTRTNFYDRAAEHARRSIWVPFAAAGTNMWFETHREALRAESEAIEAEFPLFNRYHSAPGAAERLADYLVQAGRSDLLSVVAGWTWSYSEAHRRPSAKTQE